MRRTVVRILLSAVAIGLLFLFLRKTLPDEHRSPSSAPPPQSSPPAPLETSDPVPPSPTFPSELEKYATESSSARDDLRLLHGFISASFLIVKNHDPRQYATNEDLTLFLRGKNPHHQAFLPQDDSLPNLINSQAQLIDRWGTPLIVHPVSRKTLELRSAGPDGVAYTGDDLSWPPPIPTN